LTYGRDAKARGSLNVVNQTISYEHDLFLANPERLEGQVEQDRRRLHALVIRRKDWELEQVQHANPLQFVQPAIFLAPDIRHQPQAVRLGQPPPLDDLSKHVRAAFRPTVVAQ
jgi:hypothetical protein